MTTIDRDYHQSAEQLILLAAKESGLLEEVAKLVAWWNQPGHPVGDTCPLCELRNMLIDGFDQFICDPAIAAERVYGEGFCIPPTEAEWRAIADEHYKQHGGDC
jgi:hypothetical protein